MHETYIPSNFLDSFQFFKKVFQFSELFYQFFKIGFQFLLFQLFKAVFKFFNWKEITRYEIKAEVRIQNLEMVLESNEQLLANTLQFEQNELE